MTPDGWRQRALDDVADIVGGGTPAKNVALFWGGDIPWATPTDLTALRARRIRTTRANISQAGLEASSAKLLPVGAVLLTSRATIGACAIADVPMATNQGFQSLVPRPDVTSEFLFYLARWLQPEFIRRAAGSTFLEVSKRSLRSVSFALPPVPEQRKIAAILSAVDEVIEKTEAVIESLQTLKKAMMQELLTRGLPGCHSRFKHTEIGEIPDEWKVVRVEDIAPTDRPCAQTGPFGQQLGPDDFQNDGVPVIKIGNVRWGYVDLTDLDYVSEQKALELARFRVREGDLLFARQGATTGRNALADSRCDGFLINYHIIRVAVDAARCDPRFLSACFNSDLVQRQVGQNKQRGNRDGINTHQILGFQFPLPPISTQRRIADALEHVTGAADTHHHELVALRSTKSALMSVLITGELRVASDENAA